jgi:hypothetical protein
MSLRHGFKLFSAMRLHTVSRETLAERSRSRPFNATITVRTPDSKRMSTPY